MYKKTMQDARSCWPTRAVEPATSTSTIKIIKKRERNEKQPNSVVPHAMTTRRTAGKTA